MTWLSLQLTEARQLESSSSVLNVEKEQTLFSLENEVGESVEETQSVKNTILNSKINTSADEVDQSVEETGSESVYLNLRLKRRRGISATILKLIILQSVRKASPRGKNKRRRRRKMTQ